MQSFCSDQKEVFDIAAESGMKKFLMLRFENCKNYNFQDFPQDQHLFCPQNEIIYKRVNEQIQKYGIELNGPIEKLTDAHRTFSKKVREIFLEGICEYFRDVDISFGKSKLPNKNDIKKAYGKNHSKEEMNYFSELVDGTPFTNLLNDKEDLKFNYERFVGIKSKSLIGENPQAILKINVNENYASKLLESFEIGIKEKKENAKVEPEDKKTSDTSRTSATARIAVFEEGIMNFITFLREFLPKHEANTHTQLLVAEVQNEIFTKSSPVLSFVPVESPQFSIFNAIYLSKHSHSNTPNILVICILHEIRDIINTHTNSSNDITLMAYRYFQ